MSDRVAVPTDPRDRGGPAQPLLLVRDLKKHFPGKRRLFGRGREMVQAVDGVSFSLAKGATLGVVGESGCGKSTTARLLLHLIRPDSGEIIFDGDGVGEPQGITVRDLRLQMQMVFQDSYSSLNPRATIADIIAFGPRTAKRMRPREARERAGRLLDQVGLQPSLYARRYPHELSGGQRQRVNIARALALEPRLLILDEAVSALDKSVEAQILNLLFDLRRELALTYIFISHDLNVVRHVSDRVVVMYLGCIVEAGPAAVIFGEPRHPYTQALLRAMPSMDPDRRSTAPPLVGDPPNPIDPPSGCRFRTRCAFAEPVCAALSPELGRVAGEHEVACHMTVPGSGHRRTGERSGADG
ncbi:MAG TPA: oligopeptide/dipeptide ABC transporter ATP-binding protein [Stellaceae bacterium]|nr:oligopeptide/dipeptide ABC transporter ATP-binding protein [Stellaceae bacterium]